MYKLTKIEEEKIVHDKIKYHINQRCINYHDNPSKMINSPLERNKKKIVIDRLFISENDTNYMILNSDTIKDKVNNHF